MKINTAGYSPAEQHQAAEILSGLLAALPKNRSATDKDIRADLQTAIERLRAAESD